MLTKLLGLFLVIATLPNSLFDYLGSYSKPQKSLRIAGMIVEGNSILFAVMRSIE